MPFFKFAKCWVGAVSTLLLLNNAALSIAGELKFDGTEYMPLGKLPGDQVLPSIALNSSNGLITWQDNTDGSGLAIRGRLLSAQHSGISVPFYINSTFDGDQENAKSVALGNGDFLIVWQTGNRGAQQIVARILGADGLFKGGEIDVSAGGINHRNPAACVLADGTIAVVWTGLGFDSDMEGVALARLKADGRLIGTQTRVNVGAEFNQRDAAVTAFADGSFIVAWISEQQSNAGIASIFARRYGANGIATSSDIGLITGDNPCSTPSVVTTDNGFLLVWNEYQQEDSEAGWDIKSRPFSTSGTPSGNEVVVNALRKGDQLNLKTARFGENVAVVFSGGRLDGSGLGIGSQLISAAGERTDVDLVLNTVTRGDQYSPALASDGQGRLIAAWSSFNSVETGLDIRAQRLIRSAPPLLAPNSPYVVALSSSKLSVSWPILEGLPVKTYRVYVDNTATPVASGNPYLIVTGLAPASVHSVRLAYEFLDGRVSPVSEAVSALTWGDDENANGLPDDWEAAVFGPNSATWPVPETDSDGDGKSNREEFMTGTDPKDPNSVLRTELRQSGQGTLLTWNARPGGLYQIQYSINLTDWSDYQGIRVATEQVVTVLVGDVPESSYFRVNYLR